MSQKKVYSNELGLDLNSGGEAEHFKWFLACLLFGKPIQQEIAKRAFLELEKAGITSPNALLETGWDRLVEILDDAHYVRYDYSTATKLLDISEDINKRYGTFGDLLKQCSSTTQLSAKLQELKGVGPKTAEIFLRDMAPVLEQKWGYTK